MRWLLLDEVRVIEKGRVASACGRVPVSPVNPECLMIEMMAQTGALLLGAESDFKQNIVFAKIQNADFSGDYAPGDPLEIRAVSENLRLEGAWITGVIQSGKKQVAQAELMLASVEALVPGKTKSITFHDEFMKHFRIREKVQ